jgi:glutathione S-transferase
MYRVFGMSTSGNCHKVRLVLENLRLPYEWVEVDTTKEETRTAGFLAMNPNGRVPTLEIEPHVYLPESNAILHYLAAGSTLVPHGRLPHAQVLQWMFFEQYSHEPYVAVARYINAFLPPDSPRRADLPRLRERGHQALEVMDKHLEARDFFVGEAYSIADIALFAYTSSAADGGFDLSRYRRIKAWLARIKSQPGYVEMPSPAAY